MPNTRKLKEKKILLAYAIGALILIITVNTPFSVPCLWRLATGIPSPACGLTRAFVLASRFYFLEAVKMNILFLPLVVGMAVYFICALVDLFSDMQAIKRFNSIMARKWVISLAVMLMALSWYYNIVRGI